MKNFSKRQNLNLTSATTHSHVGLASHCHGGHEGVFKAATDAEVTQFNASFVVGEDVGGLDVSVDDLQVAV